jgi:outer membrane biosynthesis protein TonB
MAKKFFMGVEFDDVLLTEEDVLRTYGMSTAPAPKPALAKPKPAEPPQPPPPPPPVVVPEPEPIVVPEPEPVVVPEPALEPVVVPEPEVVDLPPVLETAPETVNSAATSEADKKKKRK